MYNFSFSCDNTFLVSVHFSTFFLVIPPYSPALLRAVLKQFLFCPCCQNAVVNIKCIYGRSRWRTVQVLCPPASLCEIQMKSWLLAVDWSRSDYCGFLGSMSEDNLTLSLSLHAFQIINKSFVPL